MPVPRKDSNKVIENIFQDRSIEELVTQLKSVPISEKKLPPNIPRETVLDADATKKRIEILQKQGIDFEYVTGDKDANNPDHYHGNIESFLDPNRGNRSAQN